MYGRALITRWVSALSVAIGGPFALSFARWEPPSDYARTVTILFCLLALFASHELERIPWLRRGLRLRTFGVACFAFGTLVAVGYSILYDKLVLTVPQLDKGVETTLYFWRGFTPLPGVALPVTADTYAAYGYDPSRIWTPGSLHWAEALLVGAHSLMFCGLTLGVAILLGGSLQDAKKHAPAVRN